MLKLKMVGSTQKIYIKLTNKHTLELFLTFSPPNNTESNARFKGAQQKETNRMRSLGLETRTF